MLSVRKNLTEILLEVTSEEISAIAQETLSKYRSKGQMRYIFVVVIPLLLILVQFSLPYVRQELHFSRYLRQLYLIWL